MTAIGSNPPVWASKVLNTLGITQLRPHQLMICEALERKQDFCVVLPTGSGKSLTFQIAPYLRSADNPSTVIVIIPLIRLGKQHEKSTSRSSVSRLTSVGIKAKYVTTRTEMCSSITDLTLTHIFLSPELVKNHLLDELMNFNLEERGRFTHIFVDESHRVAKWGYSKKKSDPFRKEYGEIGSLRAVLPEAVMVALTATAPPKTLSTIKTSLCMSEGCQVVRVSPNKHNIRYAIRKLETKGLYEAFGPLINYIKTSSEIGKDIPKTIIFCRQYKHVGVIYAYLHSRLPDDTVQMYHRQVSDSLQEEIVENFSKETSLRVIVCTSSFSMGMDIPGLRYVYHYGMPTNMDDYIQETGRVGRDGLQSYAVALIHSDSNKGPNMTSEVKNYSKSTTCLRKQLLAYFDKTLDIELGEKCCSNCSTKLSISEIDDIPPPIDASPSVCRPKMSDTSLVLCREKLCSLGEETIHPLLPSHVGSQIYPKLMDLVMREYEHIGGVQHICTLGAYSSQAAQSIFDILEEFAPLNDSANQPTHGMIEFDQELCFSDGDD